jgi:hypothetical protein
MPDILNAVAIVSDLNESTLAVYRDVDERRISVQAV